MEPCSTASTRSIAKSNGELMRYYPHIASAGSLNACRVAYTIEEEAPLLKYCEFAFGTLAEPGEQGEECFPVEWRAADDTVFYEVFAFAPPTPGPEAVLGRLPAEHGRSRRVWRETIGSVVT
jgi:uncharacterized protein (UPF0548 family)